MIMPTKIVKPVDSLLAISSEILKIIKVESLTVDNLLEKLNNSYYKIISIEKLLLCLDFLYIIDKIEGENEIITARF